MRLITCRSSVFSLGCEPKVPAAGTPHPTPLILWSGPLLADQPTFDSFETRRPGVALGAEPGRWWTDTLKLVGPVKENDFSFPGPFYDEPATGGDLQFHWDRRYLSTSIVQAYPGAPIAPSIRPWPVQAASGCRISWKPLVDGVVGQVIGPLRRKSAGLVTLWNRVLGLGDLAVQVDALVRMS